ncbi:hypothetical protein VPH35_064104 [Triticum aestivum]
MAFCKDFNTRTHKYKAETPMQATLTVYMDSTSRPGHSMVRASPAVPGKKRLGKACWGAGEDAVMSLSLRHVYEIAKLKQADPLQSIIGTPKSMGIEIVKDL